MSFIPNPQRNDEIQAASQRRRVERIIEEDIDQAYEVAKLIKHPWYRCQSLAKIAEYSNETFCVSILKESFSSAMMCHDENRRVEVACWPLRVAIKRKKNELAQFILQECVQQLGKDKHPVSRWCATSVLHTIKREKELTDLFFEAFKKATREGHGWLIERSIKYLLNDEDVQKHHRYIDHLRYRIAEIQRWKDEHQKQKSS